jgi:hypothetical protein
MRQNAVGNGLRDRCEYHVWGSGGNEEGVTYFGGIQPSEISRSSGGCWSMCIILLLSPSTIPLLIMTLILHLREECCQYMRPVIGPVD